MSEFDVIIIGAGVGGLTCGSLLSQKGLKILMVEKNKKVGGCCSSFEKEGFSFDLSVQSLGECQRGGRVWKLLERLDLLDQIQFIPLEPAREYYFPEQRVLQSSNLESHIENLSRLFPDERKGIEAVYRTLDEIYREFSEIPSSVDWFDPSSFSLRFPTLSKYKWKTYQDLLDENISHPFLKTLLSVRTSYGLLPPEEISVIGMAGIEMSYFRYGVSCIEGKVERFPLLLEKAFLQNGGKILKEQEVDRILFSDRKAIGIRCKGGEEISARAIVSNIDASHTFLHLVGEDRLPSGFLSKLKGMRPSFSYFILYLGIDGELEELPVSNNEIFFDSQLSRDYQFLYQNRISENPSYYLLAPSKVNPSHSPKGKSTLCLSLKVPYHLDSNWDQGLQERLSQYLITKASLLIPDLKKRILTQAETTPKTIEQWTRNRWGAAYGWALIPNQSGIYRLSRNTPFENLFLSGHWTSPGGGIAGVVASGEFTANRILEKFERGEF